MRIELLVQYSIVFLVAVDTVHCCPRCLVCILNTPTKNVITDVHMTVTNAWYIHDFCLLTAAVSYDSVIPAVALWAKAQRRFISSKTLLQILDSQVSLCFAYHKGIWIREF